MKYKFLFFFLVIFSFIACTEKHDKQLVLSDRITAVEESNIFSDPLYFNWCSSILKDKDGKYHMFYARWKHDYHFAAWLTFSEVAHAVAEKPEGPYHYVNTVLSFEKEKYDVGDFITAHNPKIKLFNGKYYLYFISTHLAENISHEQLVETARQGYTAPYWKELRSNQRTYVAVADSINGTWQIDNKPLIEPLGPIKTLVVNPAVTQGNDNKFYLIVKGDKPGTSKFIRNQAVAVSNFPDHDFMIQPKPVIGTFDTEDISMWFDKKTDRFYAIFHASNYLGLMTSIDGINWNKAKDFEVTKKIFRRVGKPIFHPSRMERPFVFVENGEPSVLSFAVKKGNDSFIVTMKLKDREK